MQLNVANCNNKLKSIPVNQAALTTSTSAATTSANQTKKSLSKDTFALLTVNSLYLLSIRLLSAILLATFIDNIKLLVAPTNTRLYDGSGFFGYATLAYAIVNI